MNGKGAAQDPDLPPNLFSLVSMIKTHWNSLPAVLRAADKNNRWQCARNRIDLGKVNQAKNQGPSLFINA
jgi:hypothetical protein